MERVELRKIALATGSAVERGDYVFLHDPQLGPLEHRRLDALLRGLPESSNDGEGWLCVATGGTSGGMRFARHDEKTLGAAARGFACHFGCERIHALDVLPAHHVSGFMSRIRCAETGGLHVPWSWKQLQAGDWPQLKVETDGWFLSLVPTQLQRLLASVDSVQRLQRFRAVFIGGGPLWPELAAAAREAKIPVSICYGMTETAAMVTAQLPGDFLSGDGTCGRALPHARLTIRDENTAVAVNPGEIGLVCIEGTSVCRGYFPEGDLPRGRVQTEDLGFVGRDGSLQIVGRRDAVIITGGKKVHPGEVEAVLRASGEFDDIAVIGVPDVEWGTAVAACYPAGGRTPELSRIEGALRLLAPYQRPKHWVAVAPWPRNAQGKLKRPALVEAAEQAVGGR